ncbi:hypothetical protein HOLleu_35255 [Holothuria leucospilota]|uniref:Endonuclease/exonuclease/phosphatase domain-containing protein n=1 Tax=Holothuria leucospilota TaxID=206669 RepID=A0A9Q0YMB1_HOLLE|nr:hypothetical protein HOLleu_35255 [Holothuria leucospilota]
MSDKIDILAITESWLTGNQRDEPIIADLNVTLPDYHIFHVPRRDRSGGDVCICLRKGFKVLDMQARQFESFEYMDLFLTAKMQQPLRLVVYRPQLTANKKPTASVFIHEFASFTEDIASTSANLLIAGDFNYHVNDSSDHEASVFLDLIDSANLVQHVSCPTHLKGHTLDLILTRASDDFISGVSTTHFLPSDHAAVTCSLSISKPPTTKFEVKFRKLNDIDLAKFRQDILSSKLHTAPCSDVNLLVQQYEAVLSELINIHAPLSCHKITARPHAPWYNDNLRKEKQKLCRRSVSG